MPIGRDHRLIEMHFAFRISAILCRRVLTLQVVNPEIELSFVLAPPSHMTIDSNHCPHQKGISHFTFRHFGISHFGILAFRHFDVPCFGILAFHISAFHISAFRLLAFRHFDVPCFGVLAFHISAFRIFAFRHFASWNAITFPSFDF
jgi:hypothetical protein